MPGCTLGRGGKEAIEPSKYWIKLRVVNCDCGTISHNPGLVQPTDALHVFVILERSSNAARIDTDGWWVHPSFIWKKIIRKEAYRKISDQRKGAGMKGTPFKCRPKREWRYGSYDMKHDKPLTTVPTLAGALESSEGGAVVQTKSISYELYDLPRNALLVVPYVLVWCRSSGSDCQRICKVLSSAILVCWGCVCCSLLGGLQKGVEVEVRHQLKIIGRSNGFYIIIFIMIVGIVTYVTEYQKRLCRMERERSSARCGLLRSYCLDSS